MQEERLKSDLEKLGDIDCHYDTYRKSSPYDDFMRLSTFNTFKPYIQGNSFDILELGCADGLMTELIADNSKSLDVVEGSIRFIEQAKSRSPLNTNFFNSMFEDFTSNKKYDAIFATYVLTHIPDLVVFFNCVKRLIKPTGLLFIAVPNARGLSRQLAVHMGFIGDLFQLSENDINHGHCRSYDRTRLIRDIEANGFTEIGQGGIIMKPLADFQMDKLIELEILRSEQLNGLYKLGLEYPELSAAIFSICKLKA